MRLRALLLAVVVALVVALGAAPAASAAVIVTLTVSNGTIGVAQKVAATVDSSAIGSPSGTVVFTADGQQIASQAVGGTLGSTATVSWTPTAAVNAVVVATFTAATGEQASATKS